MTSQKLQGIENWIFDWSGTLVDDLAIVLDATNHVLRSYGKESIDRAEFRHRFRLPYAGFYEQILPGVPLEELEDHFREGFSASAAAGTEAPLLPHAREFLDFLANRGKRMFILSSMDDQAFQHHAVELGVDHFFDTTYAGVLDKRDLIHSILETHSLSPADTVFVGDMEHDVATARHGGVHSIALLTGYQDEEQLLMEKPDFLCADLSQLKQHILA
ncbi:MAG: HAD family hydrolase [Akkermansiaceae bacterium]